jgi:type III secretion protein C
MIEEKSLRQAKRNQALVWAALISCGSCLSPVLISTSRATALDLPNEMYPYIVIEQDITVVLREFGQNLGINVKLSPRVSGVVKGKLPPSKALNFLNRVCQANGLQWYFDGSVLYVSSVAEEVTRFLPLAQTVTPEMLLAALKRLSFYDERYPIRQGPDGASVFISGPPAYAALIEQTLTSMHAIRPEIPTETIVYRGGSVSVERFVSSKKQ